MKIKLLNRFLLALSAFLTLGYTDYSKADNDLSNLFDKASDLSEKGKSSEAIEIYDEIYKRYSSKNDTVLKNDALAAASKKSKLLLQLGRTQEALDYSNATIHENNKANSEFEDSIFSDTRHLKAMIFMKQRNFAMVEKLYIQDMVFFKKLNGYKIAIPEWLFEVFDQYTFLKFDFAATELKRADEVIGLYYVAIEHFSKNDPNYWLEKPLIQTLEYKSKIYLKLADENLELSVYDEIINKFKNIKHKDVSFYVGRAMAFKSALLKTQGKQYFDLALESSFFENTNEKVIDEGLDKINLLRVGQ